MEINTTYDLFWLLAGLSLFLFTVFVCWAIFYLIMIVRDTREIIKNFKKKMELIDEFVSVIKEKIEDTTKYVKTVMDIVVKITDWMNKRRLDEGETEEETKNKRKKKQ